MNVIIRDVPKLTSDNVKIEADRLGISQQELLSNLLEKAFGEPPLTLGYVKIDRPGDLSVGEDCPECSNPASEWWLKFASNGVTTLVCNFCATSE